MAIFLCPLCEKKVKRRADHGIKQLSCGCERFHGYSGTRLYHIWEHIKDRCLNDNNDRYSRYGGRGILLCREWMTFKPFLKWANKNGYSKDLQIDRIDNDGNYCPDNCRFTTIKENNRNRPSTKLSMEKAEEIRRLKAKKVNYKKIASMFGISESHVYQIVNRNVWV